MYKKAKLSLYIFSVLTLFLVAEFIYIDVTDGMSKKQIDAKKEFVSLVGLPDLAISTEATFIRHRSLASTFDIYKDDGVLREYFPSSFIIMNSKIGGINE